MTRKKTLKCWGFAERDSIVNSYPLLYKRYMRRAVTYYVKMKKTEVICCYVGHTLLLACCLWMTLMRISLTTVLVRELAITTRKPSSPISPS